MIVTCVDRFRKLVRIFRFCANICGADFGDRNYNPWNPLVFMTLSSIVFFSVCTVYTIYAGLVYDNDWTVILQCLCLASSAFQSDQLLLNIYTECLWYELTVQQQQMMLLMLIKAQSPVVLNIGKVMPLSLSSALQLTKAIYSFLMMLLNFLE
uniref:Odorant receptor n=1 Tax=Glossina austeni TaxID=7395 RepID=A0A1A9V907_GLOAU